MKQFQKLFLIIQMALALLVGLISILLSIILNVKQIFEVFIISTFSTVIAFTFIFWALKKAFKNNANTKTIWFTNFFDNK